MTPSSPNEATLVEGGLGEATAERSLRQATRRALSAARQGDLDAVRRALTDRQLAIADAAPQERADALRDGVAIGRLLTELKCNIVAKHNRLEQLRSLLAKSGAAGAINLEA